MSSLPQLTDIDPQETREWQEAIDVVIEREGPERARFLLEKTFEQAYNAGAQPPSKAQTPYLNSIPVSRQPAYPGDRDSERKILRALRWNATAMVLRANRKPAEPGGHIASYQSSARLYEIGYNHFWKGADHRNGADLVFVQGHCAPGIYARAFLAGRIGKEQLENFRIEAGGKGISSYPCQRRSEYVGGLAV